MELRHLGYFVAVDEELRGEAARSITFVTMSTGQGIAMVGEKVA